MERPAPSPPSPSADPRGALASAAGNASSHAAGRPRSTAGPTESSTGLPIVLAGGAAQGGGQGASPSAGPSAGSAGPSPMWGGPARPGVGGGAAALAALGTPDRLVVGSALSEAQHARAVHLAGQRAQALADAAASVTRGRVTMGRPMMAITARRDLGPVRHALAQRVVAGSMTHQPAVQVKVPDAVWVPSDRRRAASSPPPLLEGADPRWALDGSADDPIGAQRPTAPSGITPREVGQKNGDKPDEPKTPGVHQMEDGRTVYVMKPMPPPT
jgi:hypothetical protein